MRTAATASYGGVSSAVTRPPFTFWCVCFARGEQTAAQQAVADIDAADTYAIELANQDVA
jgi:hypothetical protein